MIRVMHFAPNEPPQLRAVDPTSLEAMQRLVDGYLEAIRLRDGLTLFCNEEGRLRGMRPNRGIPPALTGWFDPYSSIIHGPFFITPDEEDRGLTDEEVNHLLALFEHPARASDEHLHT